jgi:hypothetical protein
VVQEPGRWVAVPERHRERLPREITREPGTHRPADHSARVEVEHHREIEPALSGPDIADITSPHPVGAVDRELAIERVRRHRPRVTRIGGGPPLFHGLGADAVRAHEPCYAVLGDPMPPLDERMPDAGATVGVAALLVDQPDFRDERTVHRTTHALGPISPGVVAGGRRQAHGT